MKIILSGASGYVGSYICRSLEKSDIEHTKISTRKWDNENSREKVKELDRESVFIHLGEESNRLVKMREEDYNISKEVVHTLGEHFSKVIYFSSVCVYKKIDGIIHNEESKIYAKNQYADMKLQSESQLDQKKDIIIRASNIFGHEPKKGTILSDLYEQAKNKKKFQLKDNKAKIDFIDLHTIYQLVEKCLEYNVNGIINACSGVNTSAYDLIDMIADPRGYEYDKVNKEERSEYSNRRLLKLLDINRVQLIHEFKPKFIFK